MAVLFGVVLLAEEDGVELRPVVKWTQLSQMTTIHRAGERAHEVLAHAD